MNIKTTTSTKKILIAPLNWGLGHATRCIPLITELQNNGFEPVIAGDGESLELLQKEFPGLRSYSLPSYNIRYAKDGGLLKFKLFLQLRPIAKAVKREQIRVGELIEKEGLVGIISDNRFGVRSDKVPSVYLTHQVNVLSGSTTFLTSRFHQKIISKFDECWIPDFPGIPKLSGKLSPIDPSNSKFKFIGSLSRFEDRITTSSGNNGTKKYAFMILLSGPEPQRTILEKKLFRELEYTDKKVLFIKGIISEKQEIEKSKNITTVNFMLQEELQSAILDSELIIARSGYSTIMDLQKLKAKVFFIPTPGQSEQEYLANHLSDLNIAPFISQKDFKFADLEKGRTFKGFEGFKNYSRIRNNDLFRIFDRSDR